MTKENENYSLDDKKAQDYGFDKTPYSGKLSEMVKELNENPRVQYTRRKADIDQSN